MCPLMTKPKLTNFSMPSTAATSRLTRASGIQQKTITYDSIVRQTHLPMVSSFNKNSLLKRQSIGFQYQEPSELSQNKISDENGWANTSDIESLIKKRIQADAEDSMERNFTSQKYFLGPERICTEKIIGLPSQIRKHYKEESISSSQQKTHLVYGYLARQNAVYYIIEEYLYVFSIEELKSRKEGESKLNREALPQQKLVKPIKLRPNCRKIHEVQLSKNMIPKQYQNKILILQYPYQLQICSYVLNKKNGNQQNHITMVNLDLRITIQNGHADFITVTENGQLLYLDQFGKMNCFSFSISEENKIKRKTLSECPSKKKRFISQNSGFFKKARLFIYEKLDFGHSIIMEKRKNFSMIYDQKRNRIYTLTARTNRQNLIHNEKKVIRIYEFFRHDEKTELNCLFQIEQEQLIRELELPQASKKSKICAILLSEADCNQQSDFVTMLLCGIKIYWRFRDNELKKVGIIIGPDISNIKNSITERKKNLINTSYLTWQKEKQNRIYSNLGEQFQISKNKDIHQNVLTCFNDHSLTVNLVQKQRYGFMYLTMKRSESSSDEYEIFPIYWNSNLLSDHQKMPAENQIIMMDSKMVENQTTLEIDQLQKQQKLGYFRINHSFKSLHPTSKKGHQLLRQVSHGPQKFIYLTNKFITNFTLLRPIDILFMIIDTKNERFCEKNLTAILGVKPYQIACMLIQLYIDKNGTYYVSKKFKRKITLILQKLEQNTKKLHLLTRNKISSKFSYGHQQKSDNIDLFQYHHQDELEVYTHREETFLKDREKYRRLFVYFCNQQLQSNPNAFEKIYIDIPTDFSSSQVQDQIEKLEQKEKAQAKFCILYISRVLYPFWRVRIGLADIGKHTLYALKIRIQELFQIPSLLKAQQNVYYKHIQIFLSKLVQIIEMSIHVSHIPSNLTLEQAVCKEPSHFQQFIFSTIRRQMKPQFIKICVDRFPFYVSKYFETLMKVFMEVKPLANVEEIKSILGRLPQYPQYFITFLKQQKGFQDCSYLKMKESTSKPRLTLQIPNLPFQNTIDFIYSKVKSRQVKMNLKFTYLKEARNRMNALKSPQNPRIQVVDRKALERLQKQYNELFKCLKLQQFCKDEVIKQNEKYLKDQYQLNLSSKAQGFLGSLLKTVKRVIHRQNDQNQNQGNFFKGIKTQNKNQLQRTNQSVYDNFDYETLSRYQLLEIIDRIDSPKLKIIYRSLFSNRGINESQRSSFRKQLQILYSSIVLKGVDLCLIENSLPKAQKGDLDDKNTIFERNYNTDKTHFIQFANYLKSQIKQIFLFLNMTKTPLAFGPLYEGIKAQMNKIDPIFKFMLSGTRECIFSVGRELVELGYDNKLVHNYLVEQNISRRFHNVNYLNELERSEYEQRKLVYDWFMGYDYVKSLKSLNQMDNFYNLTVKIIEATNIKSQYKQWLIKEKQTLFYLINGNHENSVARNVILNNIMKPFASLKTQKY